MSAPFESTAVRIRDQAAVGEARRVARALATALGFDQVATEEAAIVATEASRNVLVHGGGGEVVLTVRADGASIDLLALDRGPGIADLGKAMRDGYSTGGTAGHGLGAISRMAALLDVYSVPGRGTALLARLGPSSESGPVEVGAVCAALASERQAGDGWAFATPGGRPVALVADGLGHGPRAAEAARAAVAIFRQHASLPADRLLERIHQALRATRGAAVAVAEVTGAGRTVRYAGIGNIAGTLRGSRETRRMVSLPGTAGHEARSIRCFEYDWPEGGVLIMHSDGVATRWDLDAYPGLAVHAPALVAGVLYRDFGRPRDDATVLVARRRA